MDNEIEIKIKVPNQTRYLRLIGKIGEVAAKEKCQAADDIEACANILNVVLTEAMANAVKHANIADPYTVITLNINLCEQELSIRVFDSGAGFDLNSIPDPDLDAAEPEESGRGLYIIRSLMDSVVYKQVNGGNVLEMKKFFKSGCGT